MAENDQGPRRPDQEEVPSEEQPTSELPVASPGDYYEFGDQPPDREVIETSEESYTDLNRRERR